MAAVLIASGAALLCAAGAVLLALVKGKPRWFIAATVFFVAGVFWMPSLNPLVALGVTVVVFAAVGIATPGARVEHEADVV